MWSVFDTKAIAVAGSLSLSLSLSPPLCMCENFEQLIYSSPGNPYDIAPLGSDQQ